MLYDVLLRRRRRTHHSSLAVAFITVHHRLTWPPPLPPMTDKQHAPSFGYEDTCVVNIKESLREAERLKFDFLSVPLFHPRSRRDTGGVSGARCGPLTRSDRELESREWISNVVGTVSPWVDCDNPDARVRAASVAVLREEVAYGTHLGLQALVLPPPSVCAPNYAAVVKQLCDGSAYQQLWVRVPLTMPLNFRNVRCKLAHVVDGWECWDNLRHLVGHHPRLSVALEICEDLPDTLDNVRLWLAEPLKAIILPTRLFIENKKGYPVLPKQHQTLLSVLLQSKLHVIFRGRPWIMGSLSYYMQYVEHLRSRDPAVLTDGERFTSSYKDALQAPLQPLMDNLESQTYETFERDPVKYERYEAALAKAFDDIHAERTGAAMAADAVAGDAIVVTVVGAGRGPLVAAALSAAKTAGVEVRVYAVEKNANAVVTLRNRVISEAWDNVTVVPGDMRSAAGHPREQADVLVSELLGSWGDNELSPECLDGAMSVMKAGGICIPCSYTSFIGEMPFFEEWPDTCLQKADAPIAFIASSPLVKQQTLDECA